MTRRNDPKATLARRPRAMRGAIAAAVAALLSASAAPLARALDGRWAAPSGSAWSSPGNWVGGVPTAHGDTAHFSTGTTQVNVDGNFTVSSITIGESSLTLTGPGALTTGNVLVERTAVTFDLPLTLLPGARLGGVHDFGGGTGAGGTGSGAYITFSGPLSASGPVALTGWGNRVLSGPTTNFTGQLAVDRGTVDLLSSLPVVSSIDLRAGATFRIVTAAGEAPARDRVNDAAAVNLGGGTLAFDAAATPGATEVLGDATLTGGFNQITVGVSATGAQPAISLGSLARHRGATLHMVARPPSAADPRERIFLRSDPTLTGGMLGGWAVGHDYATGTAADLDFLTYNLAAGLRALGAAGRATSIAAATAADNVLLTAPPAAPLAADTTVNSLVLRNTAPAATWALDLGGHTLNLVSGGLLATGGASLINGRLTAGGTSSAPAELFVRGPVAADIVDNPAGGSVSVVLSAESGSVRLTGKNTYSGATILNRGAFNISAGVLPTKTALEINGGFFGVGGAVTVGSVTLRNGVISGGTSSTLAADAYDFQGGWIEGVPLTGSAPLTKSSPDEVVYLGYSPNYTGPVTVLDGDLLVRHKYHQGVPADGPLGTAPITVKGGRLVAWNGKTLPNPITLAGGALASYGTDTGPGGFPLGTAFTGPIDVTADSAVHNPTQATLTFSGPLTIAPGKTLTKTGFADLRLAGPVTAGPGSMVRVRDAAFSMTSAGHDDLTLRGETFASLTFHAPVRLAALDLARSSAKLAAGKHTLRVRSLTLDASSSLDLADGALLLDYAPGASPLADVRAALAAGRLTSSLKSATRALGYAEAADVLAFSPAGAAPFLSQTVDRTTLLVRLTLPGDATLDGRVNFDDLLHLAAHYNRPNAHWHQGDFDYNGSVNFDDLLLLASRYNAALPTAPLAAAPPEFAAALASAFASVPEPTTLTLLAAPLLLATARRRRRPG